MNDSTDFDLSLTAGSIKGTMSAAKASSRDLWFVDVDKLRAIEGFNVRVKDAAYHAHVRKLADSMKSEGFYADKPLAGYVGKVDSEDSESVIYFYDGHCRYAAVLLANSEGAEITRLPVVVSQRGISREDLTVALVNSNAGKPLTPYEVGVVCKRLVRYALDVVEIAKRFGITAQYVNNLLSLMAAPMNVQMYVVQGIVSATYAIDVVAKHGDKAAEVLAGAKEVANAKGKARVTKKDVDPEVAAFKRVVKKNAQTMYDLVSEFIMLNDHCDDTSDVAKRMRDLIETIDGSV